MTLTCTEAELTEDILAAKAINRNVRRTQRECMRILKLIGGLEGNVLALRQSQIFDVEEVEDAERKLDLLWMDIYGLIAETLAGHYTADDVASWYMRAVDMGAKHPRVGATLIEQIARLEKVALAPLRARYEEVRASEKRLAEHKRDSEIGWATEEEDQGAVVPKLASALAIHAGDVPRFIGSATYKDRGETRMYIFTNYDRAVKMARVLGLTPHQAGI